MADTLSDALSLFTKVNSKIVDRLNKLEKASGSSFPQNKKKPEEVVETATPVYVEDFSRKALEDLSKIAGGNVVKKQTDVAFKPKKESSILDKLLGLLGLGGLAPFKETIMKFLKDRFKNLITGAWGSVKGAVGKGFNAAKGFLSKLGKGIGNAATWLKGKVGKAFEALKNTKVGKAISEFFSNAAGKIKSIGSKVAQGAKSLVSKAAEKVTGVGGKAVSGVKGAASAVGGFFKNVGGKALDLGKSAVSKVSDFGGAVATKFKKVKSLLSGFKLTGKILGKILKLPVIGPLIEGFLTAGDINAMIKKHEEDPQGYPLNQLFNDIGDRVAKGVGGLVGSGVGAFLGGALGSVVPGAGTFIGGVLGGVGGDIIGRWLGGAIASKFEDQTGAIGKFVYKKIKGASDKDLEKEDIETEQEIPVGDATINVGNKIVKPHPDDTIYAMRENGPMDKYFINNLKTTNNGNKILENYSNKSTSLLTEQIRLLTQANQFLSELSVKLSQPSNIVSSPTVISNSFSSGVSLRAIQGVTT